MAKPSTKLYENNPLLIATKGLELLFAKAISVAVLFLVFIGLGFFAGLPSTFMPSDRSTSNQADMQHLTDGIQSLTPTAWVVIGVIILCAVLAGLFIKIVINGISDYTASQLTKDKTVTLGQALGGVFSHFWGYSWVFIIVAVKTFLWTLLFIIPGIIMSVRYSLSGVSYFDKKLSGSKAVTHSLSLTKGAWLTTFASQLLLPMLTLGALQRLTTPGTTAMLYRQYSASDGPKPPAHVVSWLTLIIPIVLVIGFVLLAVALIALAVVFNSAG